MTRAKTAALFAALALALLAAFAPPAAAQTAPPTPYSADPAQTAPPAPYSEDPAQTAPPAPYSADPAYPSAEPLAPELSDELSRQTELLDLSPWERYFADAKAFLGRSFQSVDEALVSLAEGGGEEPGGILSAAAAAAVRELRPALASCAVLVLAGLLTTMASGVPDEGIKGTLTLALLAVCAGAALERFISLAHTAFEAVSMTSDFAESTLPVVSTLLTLTGADAAQGLFHPLMSFLSGTVIAVISRAALPLSCACGMLRAADPIAGEGRLAGLSRLISRAVKWLLGLVSAVYFAVTQVRGLNAAARDGVAVRTARYAIDRLVPVVGSMVSGTVDGVMACSLLIRNGAGTLALILLFSAALKPLMVLGFGALSFRAAAALCRPACGPRVYALYSGLADTASELFACTAAAVLLLTLTLCVFLASGGAAAGLW